ncbi:MAG: phosphatidate cytidylyltransferase [Rhodobacteraceae bacterium]|nr:phosphatidate cytidylyltransferase [Paracoccaceae bacterium]
MTAAAGRFPDLATRLGSGAVLAGIGIAAIWAGGLWFEGLAVGAATVMIWELARMQAPGDRAGPYALAALALAALVVSHFLPRPWGLVPLFAPGLVALALRRPEAVIFAAYGTAVLLASHGLVAFRAEYGGLWLSWLVAVVVVTDIAGYFAGRLIGGPKFWPRVSPKKTWAGIVAGWVGGALVGFAFLGFTTAGRDLPWISAALSFASQLGDIAESAIKRRAGVKDASQLIPGHGGLLDRFDALLGGALFMLVVSFFVVVPVARG